MKYLKYFYFPALILVFIFVDQSAQFRLSGTQKEALEGVSGRLYQRGAKLWGTERNDIFSMMRFSYEVAGRPSEVKEIVDIIRSAIDAGRALNKQTESAGYEKEMIDYTTFINKLHDSVSVKPIRRENLPESRSFSKNEVGHKILSAHDRLGILATEKEAITTVTSLTTGGGAKFTKLMLVPEAEILHFDPAAKTLDFSAEIGLNTLAYFPIMNNPEGREIEESLEMYNYRQQLFAPTFDQNGIYEKKLKFSFNVLNENDPFAGDTTYVVEKEVIIRKKK